MITRTVLTLLLGAVLIPAADRPDRPEKLAFKPLTFTAPRAAAFKARLKNGIPVFIHADPEGAPLVRLNVAFRGGTYMDPKGKEGLASLMGSQWRAGGSERTNAEALNERLEFLAAAISSGCGDTSGSLGLEVMGKDLQEGLDLFMQVLTRPAFAQDRLDRAKKSRLQGISSRNDSINSIAGYQMPFLLNGEGHFSSSQPTAASL
jgi:predicted Zn-dependent peptidase